LNIVIQTAANDGAAWADALSRRLPAARVHRWPEEATNDVDYALLWKPPAALLERLSRAKAIFNLGAGVDSLHDLPALPRHVPLVRLEDAGMGEQMAEYATYAVLRRYREFDFYGEQQRSAVWRPRRRLAKSEFVVGILGMGVLGTAVAAALAPLRFPLRGWSRTCKPVKGVQGFAGDDELTAFLGGCRVLICLLPLTRQTHGMLNRETLSRLPQGAYVVNAARGPLIVAEDLLALVESGHLGGAMLDVFDDEPLPPAHRFWHHPRITITPHVSAVTQVEASVDQIADKIRRLEAGLPITGIVDLERGY
jgi:glyoxylate/hydroxypyruvate reductase A